MAIQQTKIRVFAFTRSNNEPATGIAASITAKWAKDYGTPTALADTNPTEAENGFYYFDLSIDERTLSVVGELFPESSTSGVQVVGRPDFIFAVPAEILAIQQGVNAIGNASPGVAF